MRQKWNSGIGHTRRARGQTKCKKLTTVPRSITQHGIQLCIYVCETRRWIYHTSRCASWPSGFTSFVLSGLLRSSVSFESLVWDEKDRHTERRLRVHPRHSHSVAQVPLHFYKKKLVSNVGGERICRYRVSFSFGHNNICIHWIASSIYRLTDNGVATDAPQRKIKSMRKYKYFWIYQTYI